MNAIAAWKWSYKLIYMLTFFQYFALNLYDLNDSILSKKWNVLGLKFLHERFYKNIIATLCIVIWVEMPSFILFFHEIITENRKNEQSSGRKHTENYDNKMLLRIQFTLEVYVYRRRL